VAGYSISIVGLNLYKNYKQSPKLFGTYLEQLGVRAKRCLCGCSISEHNPLTVLMFLLNGTAILMSEQSATGSTNSPRKEIASTSHDGVDKHPHGIELVSAHSGSNNGLDTVHHSMEEGTSVTHRHPVAKHSLEANTQEEDDAHETTAFLK
jgi:hypothetical protein